MRPRVVNAIVWAVLAFGVPAAVVAFGPTGDAESAAGPAPRHEASACRPCRGGASSGGRALPYEIDGGNVGLTASRPPGIAPADD